MRRFQLEPAVPFQPFCIGGIERDRLRIGLTRLPRLMQGGNSALVAIGFRRLLVVLRPACSAAAATCPNR